jgi:hypothetical protein
MTGLISRLEAEWLSSGEFSNVSAAMKFSRPTILTGVVLIAGGMPATAQLLQNLRSFSNSVSPHRGPCAHR